MEDISETLKTEKKNNNRDKGLTLKIEIKNNNRDKGLKQMRNTLDRMNSRLDKAEE